MNSAAAGTALRNRFASGMRGRLEHLRFLVAGSTDPSHLTHALAVFGIVSMALAGVVVPTVIYELSARGVLAGILMTGGLAAITLCLIAGLHPRVLAFSRCSPAGLLLAALVIDLLLRLFLFPYAYPVEMLVGWQLLVLVPGPAAWSIYLGIIAFYQVYANVLIDDGPSVVISYFNANIHSVPIVWLTQSVLLWLVSGITVRSLCRILLISRKLRSARNEIAGLAAAVERGKLARLLHDRIGQDMVAVMLRTELVQRMGERDPERAATELAAIHRTAKDTLTAVRAIAHGTAGTGLEREIQGATTLLEAVGIRCELLVSSFPPGAAGEALGWIVREAVTNILKHSTAASCRIQLCREHGADVLEIRNDGLAEDSDDRAVRNGFGLSGIAARARELDGAAEVTRTGGVFVLTVRIPVQSGSAGDSPAVEGEDHADPGPARRGSASAS